MFPQPAECGGGVSPSGHRSGDGPQHWRGAPKAAGGGSQGLEGGPRGPGGGLQQREEHGPREQADGPQMVGGPQVLAGGPQELEGGSWRGLMGSEGAGPLGGIRGRGRLPARGGDKDSGICATLGGQSFNSGGGSCFTPGGNAVGGFSIFKWKYRKSCLISWFQRVQKWPLALSISLRSTLKGMAPGPSAGTASVCLEDRATAGGQTGSGRVA